MLERLTGSAGSLAARLALRLLWIGTAERARLHDAPRFIFPPATNPLPMEAAVHRLTGHRQRLRLTAERKGNLVEVYRENAEPYVAEDDVLVCHLSASRITGTVICWLAGTGYLAQTQTIDELLANYELLGAGFVTFFTRMELMTIHAGTFGLSADEISTVDGLLLAGGGAAQPGTLVAPLGRIGTR
jgi:hypothetical protein